MTGQQGGVWAGKGTRRRKESSWSRASRGAGESRGKEERWNSPSWASNNVTNVFMEADTFQFMQPKHFPALEEEGCLIQPEGEKSQGAAEKAGVGRRS